MFKFLTCVLCQKPSKNPLCQKCRVESTTLIHTRHEYPRLVPGTKIPLFSFSSYHGKVKELIHIAKSPRQEYSALVDPWLWLASQRLCSMIRVHQPQIIVPLPERRFGLDSRRRLARDFAQLLASQLGKPCSHDFLGYRNPFQEYLGEPQKLKTRWQRQTSPPQFSIRNAPRERLRVLLVDDVCTTGESLRAAIKPLQLAGFQVSGAALLADTPAYV